jgi:hypothetical protein
MTDTWRAASVDMSGRDHREGREEVDTPTGTEKDIALHATEAEAVHHTLGALQIATLYLRAYQ